VKSISGLTGISQNTVNNVCVDHVGNIWMGTNFGLNRYDGRDIKKYFFDDSDSLSLPNDFIVFVYEDQLNNLWISTSTGLCIYDRLNDCFIRNPFGEKLDFLVQSVFEDEDKIWFPDYNLNFYTFDKNTQTFSKFPIKKGYKSSSNFSTIVQAIPYDKNHLLLLIHRKGLVLLDKKTGIIDEFLNAKSKNFTKIVEINNAFYLSSFNDVYKISKDGKILKRFSQVNPAIGESIFLSVNENPFDHTIWISTDYYGIFIVDNDFNILNTIESGSANNQVLPENSIKNIHFVNQYLTILGTVRCGGIFLYKSELQQFRFYKKNENGPSDKSILCFTEDRDKQIWVGTDGGGLNYFDKEKEIFKYFSSPNVQIVTSILDYSKNRLLVGSYEKGLFFFDKRKREFSNAKSHPFLKKINSHVRHKIFKDSENNIWISDGSIVKINFEKNTFERFNQSSNHDLFNKVAAIYYSAIETKSNVIWFTTAGGLFSYSLKTNRIEDSILLSDIKGAFGDIVYSVVEDKNDNLIFGTNKGLYLYNIQTKEISSYIDHSNHKDKMFLSLFIDKNNILWAGTNESLIRIEKNDSTEDISIINNLESEGGMEFRYGASLLASDGKLYLGSNEGITCFVPENIKIDTSEAKVVITSFERMSNNKGIVSDSIIAVDCTDELSVELNYAHAIYQFKFNSFNYPFEEYTKYSYTLENFDDGWHTGRLNTATYTNLDAGNYIFKVRSTNKTGKWNTKTTNIYLKILPPWWQTAWFRIIFLISIFIILFLIWRESLIRLKLKHQLILRNKEKEHIEYINQQKLTFFTNISHELKTPLTLIYSPLKHLLKGNASDTEIRNSLPSLYRNTKRLSALIEQILEFRKAEMTTLKLNAACVNITKLTQNVADYFDYHSKIEDIKIVIEADAPTMMVDVDSDKFTKIMFNLISNALKHSLSGDMIFILLTFQGENIKIEVRDNGDGISQSEFRNIFKRYYQVKTDVTGTGIGLALTKHLVELHGGKITVKSEVKKGSVFTILLPKKQKHITKTRLENINTDVLAQVKNSKTIREDSNTKSKTELSVLIVEDEWDLRHFLKTELAKNYNVLLARNGKEGVDIAIKESPDLIISDVMMPEMDGIELCEAIKNDIRVSHIPVILLTAKTSFETQAEGFRSGADIYIPKPFDLNLLKMQIESLLRNRQILKNRFGYDLELHPKELPQSEIDKKFLEKAIEIVEQNMENQDFKVSDFVNELGMSRTLIYKKINAIAGKPVKDFILHIRLRKAAKLLTTQNIPISQIAFECGFSDQSYFSTVFKRYYNQSPIFYRTNQQQISIPEKQGSE
jgi:signal transduction histidine kinase/DNA-binding response OmpR family regulator/ligand-binding sensor domain-containing protein